MIDSLHSSPLGFFLGVVTSAVFSGWLATSGSGLSIAPAHLEPGQTTRSRGAGVREAIGRLEDSVERCCAGRTVETPAPVCKCGLGDTLSDLLQGFALGAGSFFLAVASWACRCCGLIGRALPSAGRPASRDSSESQPAVVKTGRPEIALPSPVKRRAGRGGPLAHLAAESSLFD